ncbi:hypothetical protein LCGC14_1043250 [marine sediment metagenome]|uniref:Uncharacterized protein n=1 Tax=marine sediment metagenome TaxID=412755 RepID=A0A0F9Q9B7_9ZZZZ
MKLFTCTDHDCHYPVGVASIIVAPNEFHARLHLDCRLIEQGLKPYDEYKYSLVEIEIERPHAIILQNGDY